MFMPSKKIVVLYSGGLDSCVMLHMAKNVQDAEVIPVYFDIGHDYAWKEKKQLPEDCQIFDMTWFSAKGRSKDGNAMGGIFIPGRNMMFATLAACKFVPDEIWLGACCGEDHGQATDKNEHFRNLQNTLLDYVLSPFGEVRLVYPFIELEMGKLQVTEYAIKNGFADKVVQSSSCMNGEEGNCGVCGVCLRRAGIFKQLGLHEEYNRDPWTAKENRDMILQMLLAYKNNDFSHYNEYRIEEIVPALRRMYPESSLDELIERYTD